MKEQMYHFKPVWYMSSLRGALEHKTRKETTLIKNMYQKARKYRCLLTEILYVVPSNLDIDVL